MRLRYRILELPFRPEAVEAVRKVYGTDISKAQAYAVIASFKTKNRWTRLERMIYDTGAVVSLLPLRYFSMLGIEKFAKVKLSGILPHMEVSARLTRTTLRLHDVEGNVSPEIEAWTAIAERDDVPRIIGLKDIANTHRFIVDPRRKEFYLEFYRPPSSL